MENKEEFPVVNIDDMVDYIFSNLVVEGIIADRKNIKKILDLEFDYLESIGLLSS